MRFVLDASVALAWFLDHPPPAYAVRIRQVLLHSHRAVVPPLWHLEMANGFVVAERRGLLNPSDTAEALQNLEAVIAAAIETVTDAIPIGALLETSRQFHLTAYDAVYLEISLRVGLPVATLDRQLSAACSRAGVELVR